VGAPLLQLLPVQREFFDDKSPSVAYIGGLGTGKSLVSCHKLLATLFQHPGISPIGAPSFYIFTGTYSQLKQGLLTSLKEALYDTWIKADARYIFEDKLASDKTLIFPRLNASIGLRSLDADQHWKSIEICVAWGDEMAHFSEQAYDRIVGRLRGTATQRRLYPSFVPQFIISSNPPHHRSHWLTEKCTIPHPKTGVPPIKLHTSSSYANPFLPAGYLAEMEKMFDPELAKAEIGGEFVDLGRDLVYRRFSREKHYLTPQEAERRGLPPLTYDDRLPLVLSCDFNLSPLCSLLCQMRRVNAPKYQGQVLYVLDSIRLEDALIPDTARELCNRREAAEVAYRNGIIFYGDSSGLSSNRQTGMSDFAASLLEFKRLGFESLNMRVPAANALHTDSTNSTNRMLEDSEGNIGIVIAQNRYNAWLVMDLERSMWKAGTSSFDLMKPKAGETIPASKMLGHLADCLRYVCHSAKPITAFRPLTARQFSTAR
jgi:hypothetical protein